MQGDSLDNIAMSERDSRMPSSAHKHQAHWRSRTCYQCSLKVAPNLRQSKLGCWMQRAERSALLGRMRQSIYHWYLPDKLQGLRICYPYWWASARRNQTPSYADNWHNHPQWSATCLPTNLLGMGNSKIRIRFNHLKISYLWRSYLKMTSPT